MPWGLVGELVLLWGVDELLELDELDELGMFGEFGETVELGGADDDVEFLELPDVDELLDG